MPTFEKTEIALQRALAAGNADGRINEAKGICLDLLERDKDNFAVAGLYGGVLAKLGNFHEAKPYIEKALIANPKVQSWYLNLATINKVMGDLDEALNCAQKALELNKTADAYVEIALIYVSRTEYSLAKKAMLNALSLDNNHPSAHMGLSELLLIEGDYRHGWEEYAWRTKLPIAQSVLPTMKAAPWNGMPLEDAAILLVCDQGFGDMIQFCRYIPEVKKHFKTVITGWGPEVTALLTDFPGVDVVIPSWKEVPEHQVFAHMSSLPQIFGTTVNTIPKDLPYFKANEISSYEWKKKLSSYTKKKIGIVWAGRETHPNNIRRSILDTKILEPIVSNPNYTFIALQKPVPEKDKEFVNKYMLNFESELESFSDTMALIDNLDLVISIDSSVAHLTGAMNKPVWLLTPKPNDWRWLLPENGYNYKTAWYNTVTLFRQNVHNKWDNVIMEVCENLNSPNFTPYPYFDPIL